MNDAFSQEPTIPRPKPHETGFSEEPLARLSWRDDIPGEMPFEPIMKSASATAQASLDRAAKSLEIPALVQLPSAVVTQVGNYGNALLLTKIVYEWSFVNYFLKALGIFMLLLSAMMLITCMIVLIVEGRIGQDGENDTVFAAICIFVFGCGFGYGGVWFTFLRRPPSSLCVWYLKHGIIWSFNDTCVFVPWSGIDLICKRHLTHIDIGLRHPFGVGRIWFWVFNTRAKRNAVAAVEITASTAKLPLAIRDLACGRSVGFGDWSISATEFMPWSNPIPWTAIDDIDATDARIVFRSRQSGDATIKLSELPFPSLFIALARGLITYWHDDARMSRAADSP